MNYKNIIFSLLATTSLIGLSSCGTSSEGKDNLTLKIYNAEDYIYEQDINEGYENEDLVDQFKSYIKKTYNKNISIVYDTYDTNESMLSELRTGKTNYDLVCCSDYTVQKMIMEDLVIPFNKSSVPNYNSFASKFLIEKLGQIKVKDANDKLINVNDYAKGYMWGTLGILYNPDYKAYKDYEKEEMINDMSSWNALFSKKYKGTISIKDSIRDTYALGVLKTFEDELTTILNDYKDLNIDSKVYNEKLTEIFNRSDKDTVDKVLDTLLDLKNNIFGFEVDSGKEDIQTGKIGINIAWSGDAVYAMDCAEDNINPQFLEYQLPETGSNIWFDAFVMPKKANTFLAQEFINFLSDPSIAYQNMEYTGYTPFIAGNEILDLVKDWYHDDDGSYERDLSYFFDGTLSDDSSCIIKISEQNRQFDTQFPSQDKLPHLAVMDDFGSNTPLILNMWEKLKETPISPIIYTIAALIFFGGIFSFSFVKIKKINEKKRRKMRRASAK